MFTGIVEATGQVLKNASSGLVLERPVSFSDLKIGSSVCVAGVCLSIVKLTNVTMTFDVVEETLAKTTLGDLKPAIKVNLERAMISGDRLDGHIVQGHVEGVATVRELKVESGKGKMSSQLIIQLPPSTAPSVVAQGSIAIDGVSLTVAKIDGDVVTVALIPHTLKHTTLGTLKEGDRVNIETDVMVRGARK